MVRGQSDFNSSETDYLIRLVLESPLGRVETRSRTKDANRVRRRAWMKIRDEFTRNRIPASSKRVVTIGQLQSKFKYAYGLYKKRHAEMARIRQHQDLLQREIKLEEVHNDDSVMTEEKIIASFGSAALFQGMVDTAETSFNGMSEEMIINAGYDVDNGHEDVEARSEERPARSDSDGYSEPRHSRSNKEDSESVQILKELKTEMKHCREAMTQQTDILRQLLDAVRESPVIRHATAASRSLD